MLADAERPEEQFGYAQTLAEESLVSSPAAPRPLELLDFQTRTGSSLPCHPRSSLRT